MELGSSQHPVLVGDHLVLANDRSLTQVVGRSGALVEPLVPIAASIGFSGLSAFSLDDDDELEELTVYISTAATEKFNFMYLEHDEGTISNSSHQALSISDIPDEISLFLTTEDALYSASSPISSITYTGIDKEQRQAVRISDFPDQFSSSFGSSSSWSSTSSIGSIEAQITNSSSPVTMGGDHFLFHHDPNDGTSTISSRISGISDAGWEAPAEEG